MTKPPYAVPTLAEIEALPKNGFKVASTFSGGGGSSTGYAMAGFSVIWANEFIKAAQETYQANHKGILDPRDIRTIQPEEILKAIYLGVGELDLLDGSPPCSAFSTVGKREKGWGKEKSYSDNMAQVVDDLFFQYTRLLRGLQPKVFIAENVSGLIKGTAKGYFLSILSELKDCGYEVNARLLNAAWLGVPQTRERLIFIGVRKDLGLKPVFPKPFSYQYTLRDAVPSATASIEGFGKNIKPNKPGNSFPRNRRRSADLPCGTITAAEAQINGTPSVVEVRRAVVKPAGVKHPYECRKFSIEELKRICTFPEDYVLTGNYRQQWERLGRSVPPIMMKNIAATVRDEILRKL